MKQEETLEAAIDLERAVIVRDVPLLADLASAQLAFFRQAASLDAAAALTLSHAGALRPVTSAHEDELVQQLAKQTSESKKEVEAHWAITQVAHSIHKALTAMRKRTTDKLDMANAIANQLHNVYVETERRRVQREQQEVQRKAELEALQAREEEVRILLAQAEEVDTRAERRALISQAAALRNERLVVDVPEVAMNVTRAAGTTSDRTTWSGELLDEQALINAILEGSDHSIPFDLLRIDTVKLNQYAR